MNDKLQRELNERALEFTWVEWACAAALVAIACALFWCITAKASASVTNAQANQIEINAQVSYGLGYQANQVLMNYVEPGTTTALFSNSTTVFVPPSTTGQTINLATLFPYINSAVIWGIQDISNPGQTTYIGTDSTDTNHFYVAPSGFLLARVYGSAPTLYVDNPSTQNYALLRVFVLAN